MRLIILGAGGFGRTIADLAAQSGSFDDICFLDDNSRLKNVIEKCADFAAFSDGTTLFYPAFGSNGLRAEWIVRLKQHGCALASFIHPTAYVSPTAQIGECCAVLPLAVVNTECVVGDGCIINCGAIVDHGCILGECVHVSPGAVVKAENRIPGGMKIESGEVIQNRTYPV